MDKSTTLNNFNNFFIDVCPDLDLNLREQISTKSVQRNENNLFLYPTGPEEVYRVIMALKNKKSVGFDEIPVVLLKEVAEHIALPLTHVINLAFTTGTFPDRLKLALIKPIHKRGEKSEFGNYLPISLLSNVSKVVEKIINSRLLSFFEKNKIINEKQNGFSKGRSTVRGVYQALNEIIDALNNYKRTAALCIDLSRAFDSVNHEILCEKLEMYGVRGVALSLIKSYLADRKQCVVAVDSDHLIYSDRVKIKRGVPQGPSLDHYCI